MAFEPVSTLKSGLDKGNAYWMARLAKASYFSISESDNSPDEDGILTHLKADDPDFRSVFGVNKNSAQAILVEHKNYLAIAFRGTDETADWLDNLDAFPTKILFGEIHRGFWKSFIDVWYELKLQMANIQYERHEAGEKPAPLFFAGHSLGGAMATVAAAHYIHEDLPFTSVYTFGQPRALERHTARIFNTECASRYFRFHNNNDIVTRVPARLMGYSHVGSYLYISQEKKIYQEPSYWFRFIDYFDGAFDSVKQHIQNKKPLSIIQDHNIQHYLEAIEKWDFEY